MKFKLPVFSGLMLILAVILPAKDKMMKTFQVGGDPKFVFSGDVAHVNVVEGPSEVITVHVQLPDKDRFRISSSQTGSKVRVNLEYKQPLGWVMLPLDMFDDDISLEVEVPQKCDLDLQLDAGRIEVAGISGVIQATTTSGEVIMDDVSDDVDINSTSGSIRIEKLSGSLDVEVGAGGIRLRDADGVFDLESSSGSIEIRNSTGQFRLISRVGTIDFEGTITKGEDNYFSSDIGSIEVTLNDQTDLEIDASADLGEVTIYPNPNKVMEQDDHNLRALLGVGGPKLTIRSDVGSIEIEKGEVMEPDEPDETPDVESGTY